MRILLTGSAGFIGQYVERELERRGHTVIGVDMLDPQVHGLPPYLPDAYRKTNKLTVKEFVERADLARNIDAVAHLGAQVGVGQSQMLPRRYIDLNVSDTAWLWEWILSSKSQIRRVVVASSMSIYGEGEYWCPTGVPSAPSSYQRNVAEGWDSFDAVWQDGSLTPLRERLFPRPTRETKPAECASVYAQSKYDQERYSILLGKAHDVPTIALRFFNVIGAGQALSNPYTGVAAGFACRVLNGRSPLVFEDGRQTRDFVHVKDVADAVCNGLEAQADISGVYNVCTSKPTSILELAEKWCAIARGRGFGDVEPFVSGEYRSGDVRHCIGDHSSILRDLGWAPQRTLDAALENVADWILWTGQHKRLPEDGSDRAANELRSVGLLNEARGAGDGHGEKVKSDIVTEKSKR